MKHILNGQDASCNSHSLSTHRFPSPSATVALCRQKTGSQAAFCIWMPLISAAANNSVERSVLSLIEELNATLTQFPDTDLTLFYELAPVA